MNMLCYPTSPQSYLTLCGPGRPRAGDRPPSFCPCCPNGRASTTCLRRWPEKFYVLLPIRSTLKNLAQEKSPKCGKLHIMFITVPFSTEVVKIIPCIRAKLLQSCPTLRPLDHSLSGSSAHGILQAGILQWVVMPSSRGSSQSRDWTHISYVSCISRVSLTNCTTWEAQSNPLEALKKGVNLIPPHNGLMCRH